MPKILDIPDGPILISEPADIGKAIATLRKQRGLNQIALAEAAGISRNTLVSIEQNGNGKVAIILRLLAMLRAEVAINPAAPPAAGEDDGASEITIDF